MEDAIQMVDLKGQYLKIKDEVDAAIQHCIDTTAFINGPQVGEFKMSLAQYLNVKHLIPCANGTDALQIALMALELTPGDEVIVPSFTYVATTEVIALLGLVPVMVDVDPNTFNITADLIKTAITAKTKVVVPVHLFGQSANMEEIMALADEHNLCVIEDNAQAIGAEYTFADGRKVKAGTIGHIGTTSFFPSKNLGCYGDGGAICTNDDELGAKIQMMANHGQVKKYVHKYIGVNSRLDTLQAGILSVKLKYLDQYSTARGSAASYYDKGLADLDGIQTPVRNPQSTHVFHQYTLLVKDGKRDELKKFLESKGIPAMIYYPVPLNEQEAFKGISRVIGDLIVSTALCQSVLSLPIHTEMKESVQDYIINAIKEFYGS
ncbi:DegT/DnrJ/EryC1/StrS family aminotransferase [Pedobacter polaris]|uniref:DegT/DnrJ/EryC1/StrS family aminotransferase n=1 Tax=Pedobacter polaris TaxID=2571273 RepID=A0A4U1CXF1_9SPHI|nr:DegT/DnrJ/EryC1/StrS family aminotransferase [Pedobacter polaris]TKC13060.1 DegT/DnrJ/EryC1/StrS family aminotransferase [Pedobacter polaris]